MTGPPGVKVDKHQEATSIPQRLLSKNNHKFNRLPICRVLLRNEMGYLGGKIFLVSTDQWKYCSSCLGCSLAGC